MGQYHTVYNLDKKEFIEPRKINNGRKLLEQVGHDKSTSSALFLLLSNSNGRGGGDAKPYSLIGYWAGDRIVVQGDYVIETDLAFIPEEEIDKFKDISTLVNEMLSATFS